MNELIQDCIRRISILENEVKLLKQYNQVPIQLLIQQPEINSKKRRSHGKIESLTEDLRNRINQMLNNGISYKEIRLFLVKEGLSISNGSVGRYAKEYLNRKRQLKEFREQTLALVP